MAECPDKNPECRGGDYGFIFSVCAQVLELQKKIVRQNVIATKVKQANSSKWLQNQIQTLEMRLNNVSKHFAKLWTRRVGLCWGLRAKSFLIRTKGNGTDAFGSHKLYEGLGSCPWPE